MDPGKVREVGRLSYSYNTQIDATQYAEDIWIEEVKPAPKRKEDEKADGKCRTTTKEASRRFSTSGVKLSPEIMRAREKADQLRAKVLKWKEERGRAIKRERQWRRELGEIVSDSSDDGDELNRKNDNNERLNAGVDLPVAEKEVEKEETLTCAAQNDGPEDSPVKAEDEEKTNEKSVCEKAETSLPLSEQIGGVVQCKKKFMVDNEWSAREKIEKSGDSVDTGVHSLEDNVSQQTGRKEHPRSKREKSAPRRTKKKTLVNRSKSEPVEGLLEDQGSCGRRVDVDWPPKVVHEGWKEIVERVKRQRQEQAILDEKKRRADEIKVETEKKMEKLRKALEETRLAEEREKEVKRAAQAAEEQRWLEEEKKRREQQRRWRLAMDKINIQAAEDLVKEQERETELTERRLAEEKEEAEELDKIQRKIEEEGEMHSVVEQYWRTREAEAEEEERLERVVAEEEEWWSGGGREEELRREQEAERRRQELVKREMDERKSIVEREEQVRRAREEAIEKQRCAVARVENQRRIEIERERALEQALINRPKDQEAIQDTLSEKVCKRVMAAHAEKERIEEERRRLDERKRESTLRQSLFPNMPIFLNFVTANSLPGIIGRDLSEGLKQMGWHVWAPRGKNAAPDKSQDEGWTIQDCTEYNGFKISWIERRPFEEKIISGHIWDSCMKLEFSHLHEEVKTNFFPGIHHLSNKSDLYMNYVRMRKEHGKEEWNFIAETFLLPEEGHLLKEQMEKEEGSFWIVKPPNLACGEGIEVIDNFKKIPATKKPLCVQRYLMDPLLIHGLKFDLRVYVLVTSVDPLRIYLYDEGLARFSTEPYTTDPKHIGNNFIHLTNYSINKDSANFEQNLDPDSAEGSKWTLTSLWKYLHEFRKIEKKPIWEKVKDIVLKSILAAKAGLQKEYEEVKSRYNCYMLLGYDILIDANLQPHLIEINSGPSLNAKPYSIDERVKHSLVSETFNIANIKSLLGTDTVDHLPRMLTHDPRVYSKALTAEDDAKEKEHEGASPRGPRKHNIRLLQALTPRDVKILVQAEEELSQTKLFERIWPTNSTHEYFKYFESLPYSEKLMETYEYVYGKNRQRGQALVAHYCQKKVHLEAPKPESLLKGPRPPDPKLILPPLLMPVEAKPKKHCGEGNSGRYSPPRVLIPGAFLRRW